HGRSNCRHCPGPVGHNCHAEHQGFRAHRRLTRRSLVCLKRHGKLRFPPLSPAMRIAIAADHAGFALKEQLRDRLAAEGHEVNDFGTQSTESTDYPDYATLVAHEVAAGRADRGVLVCSTGIGMSIAANKVEGVRAALVTNLEVARITRQHNDSNII